MPLDEPRKGASKKVKRRAASKNISKLRKEGFPEKQAIAAGLSAAGLSKKGKGKKRSKKGSKHNTGHTFE